jgi:hypothetical protein
MRRTPILFASTTLAAPFITSGAYDNTLTRLIPDLYAGLDVVSREMVGFIPSVFRNVSAERAAKGQAVVYDVAPALVSFDVTPNNVVPDPDDVSFGSDTIIINKSKGAAFGFTGEEAKGLNTGSGYVSAQAGLFAQALRVLVNEIEVDLATEASVNFSRAYGTAGTTPFASDLSGTAQIRKILDDNGAPASGRALVIDTTAGANMRTLSNLTKANEAGTAMTLRDGELLNVHGMSIKESAGVLTPVSGTGASATTNSAGYAAGAKVITLAAAGTGTILAGDVITFAGDANKYIVDTGVGAVSGGVITLAAPGLQIAIAASATALTVVATSTRNAAFSQNALHLVARAPALPPEGDLATERRMLVDPRSGLAFEVAIYPMYRKMRAEVSLAWGVKATKTEHGVILLG